MDQSQNTSGRDPRPRDASPDLEPYRGYLLVLAEVQLDAALRRKLDAADVVQQALLKASVNLPALNHREPNVVRSWLREILANEITDAWRFYHRDRRDVDREASVHDELKSADQGFERWLAAEQTSPSRQAARNEESLRLADALIKLPDDVREAVMLKHLQNLTLRQIAERTGRSGPAVASLLRRGLSRLRALLQSEAAS